MVEEIAVTSKKRKSNPVTTKRITHSLGHRPIRLMPIMEEVKKSSNKNNMNRKDGTKGKHFGSYCSDIIKIPCRSGMCTSPIHVTSSQLVASDVFPVAAVKALLYPGVLFNDLIYNASIPSWNNVLDKYNLTDIKGASAMPDLQRLEVLAGSYFSVAGAFIGLLKPQRMSMFGTLLIIWGLVKEGLLGKPINTDPTRSVYVYPTMLIAVLCAFSSVKYNFQKAATKPPPRSAAKPLKSSKKSKLK